MRRLTTALNFRSRLNMERLPRTRSASVSNRDFSRNVGLRLERVNESLVKIDQVVICIEDHEAVGNMIDHSLQCDWHNAEKIIFEYGEIEKDARQR
jgi:hypothetical protein